MFLFDHFGELSLARPTLTSLAIIALAITMRWRLRRHPWFWIATTIIVILHVLAILFVPWNTKWVPAVVIIPIGIGDLYAMLAVFSIVGRFAEKPKISHP